MQGDMFPWGYQPPAGATWLHRQFSEGAAPDDTVGTEPFSLIGGGKAEKA